MAYASKDKREAAVSAYKSGKYTQQMVADIYGICRKTLYSWLKTDAEGRPQEPKAERGHPPCVLDESDYAEIYRRLKANPFITCAEMRSHLGDKCSEDTVRRAYHKLGFSHKKRSKVASQRLKPENVAKRERFLEMRKEFDPERLVLVDESGVRTNYIPLYG